MKGCKTQRVKIIKGAEFDDFLKSKSSGNEDEKTISVVKKIIAAVRVKGDWALRRYSGRFEKSVPEHFEISVSAAKEAWDSLNVSEPALASSLVLAADHIRRFGELQKEQFADFESEIAPGLVAGQKVIPVDSAAVYAPGGRFPLISSALMGLIPAAVAGVREKILASPPADNGLPDRRILAAAYIAGADRIFAVGGAQAIAALALGTETVPKADLIVGPGNKYVAAAKRLLFGEAGIDLIAGPTDVLIITDEAAGNREAPSANGYSQSADFAAADMLAQAEHDPDAAARVLAPNEAAAERIAAALEKRLALLPASGTAAASLEKNGLIIIYDTKEEAVRIANRIAPEHLELHVSSPGEWISGLKNYGSLFIGLLAVEALGDYAAGINHTLPTSSSARFTGGLSVRNFLKTVTTLRCVSGKGYADALAAAQSIARAEGLDGHAESAAARSRLFESAEPRPFTGPK